MESQISSSVCVRLTSKCRDSVELVDKSTYNKKQIRLINRNSNDFLVYEFDEIFGKQFTNEKLYENLIFTSSCQSVLDLDSALYCFIGSQGVGKSYTITGQPCNISNVPGLLTLLVQQVFQQNETISNQLKNSLNSVNQTTVALRFLQIFNQTVQNIGFQIVYGDSNKERQFCNRINYKIDIKNIDHFQNTINKIYERKKPHMHLIIEATLKTQNLIYATKKAIVLFQQYKMTFIQISSACFDEGNIHSQKIKNQVEAFITIFQNIPRIKHLEHLFQTTKITKMLKNNFFEAKKIYFIGILDNSFKGNSVTLKWLKKALELKQDKTIIDGMKQDIKREEEYLKNLIERHKKVMTLLSKCIGTQLSFLQKQKNFSTNRKQAQFGFGNSYNKRCQKIKIANLKKQQNQLEIDNLNKQISTVQNQINSLEVLYKQNLKKLQQEKKQVILAKNNFIAKMEQKTQHIFNTNLSNSTNNSFYWKTDHKQLRNQSVKSYERKNNDYFHKQRENIKIGNFSRENSIKTMLNPLQPQQFIVKKSSIAKIERKNSDQSSIKHSFMLQANRQQNVIKKQTKRQIYQLFRMISEQQQILSSVLKEKQGQLSTKTINKIKIQQNNKILNQINEQQLQKYLIEGKLVNLKDYLNFVKNQQIHNKFCKYLHVKENNTQQTIKTISPN